MWIAYTRDGKKIQEGEMSWEEAKKFDIVQMDCVFGGTIVHVLVPNGCVPIMFYTGEIDVRNGSFSQISQVIGYSDGKIEIYSKIGLDGEVSEETITAIH